MDVTSATIFACMVLQHSVDVSGLMCYSCSNEHANTMCVGDHILHECLPTLDTCQTSVDYSDATEMITITKTCTKNASCHLAQEKHMDIPCDLSNKDWVCISCCHGDGCNINAAPHVQTVCYLLTFFSCFIFLRLYKIFM